jgi:hypothetical protein
MKNDLQMQRFLKIASSLDQNGDTCAADLRGGIFKADADLGNGLASDAFKILDEHDDKYISTGELARDLSRADEKDVAALERVVAQYEKNAKIANDEINRGFGAVGQFFVPFIPSAWYANKALLQKGYRDQQVAANTLQVAWTLFARALAAKAK